MKISVVLESTSIFGCLPGLTFLITSSLGFFHCYSTSSYFVPYAEAVLQVESWSSLNMIFSLVYVFLNFLLPIPFLRTLFRRHQDKTKQEEMKKTGSAEERRRQDQVVPKEETCSGLAGLVGLRYSRRFFIISGFAIFWKACFSTSERAKGRQMWKHNFRKCVWFV